MSLSKRAVACKVWRWEPGMPDQHGRIYVGLAPDDGDWGPRCEQPTFFGRHGAETSWTDEFETLLPDLTSDATRGWMMKFVREIHGECAHLYPVKTGIGVAWCVTGRLGYKKDYDQVFGDTQEEAIVMAMEAKPWR